jgi:dTMP kinase
MSQKGFIVIDGIDGGGKTTQIQMLADRLRKDGRKVVLTREPGGSPLAERIRTILLQRENCVLTPEQEAVLFAAARSDHIAKTVLPALADGAIVICDRFALSTRVYQGMRGVSRDLLLALEKESFGDNGPSKTIVIDVPVDISVARIQERSGDKPLDFFEQQRALIGKFRGQFQREYAASPTTISIVDGDRDPETVHQEIYGILFGRH